MGAGALRDPVEMDASGMPGKIYTIHGVGRRHWVDGMMGECGMVRMYHIIIIYAVIIPPTEEVLLSGVIASFPEKSKRRFLRRQQNKQRIRA